MNRPSGVSLALALSAAACSPPVYHRGPPSDHFTGTRFFNPEGQRGAGGSRTQGKLAFAWNKLAARRHWPARIPVTPGTPPARVPGPAMRVTWIGHSTVLVQADGLNILTDPIWSERASPVSFAGPKRVRAPGVRFGDLPRIDLVLVSHSHYDHMDVATLRRLWARDRPLIVTGLGNEVVLGKAGVPAVARDWGGVVDVRPGIRVRLDRVHHWSARGLRDRDATLWTGFTVALPHGDLYFAGDTGAGDMAWVKAARAWGPPRLAILPIGAIGANGRASGNHITPATAVTAMRRIGAASALAVHWGTFELTDEGVDQPPRLLAAALRGQGVSPARFRVLAPGVGWAVPQSSAK